MLYKNLVLGQKQKISGPEGPRVEKQNSCTVSHHETGKNWIHSNVTQQLE